MIKRRLLDAAIARWSSHPNAHSLLVRGSYLLGVWIGETRRRCDDLDFVAVGHYDQQLVRADLLAALSVDLRDDVVFDVDRASVEEIFAETDFPGLRFTVPFECESEQSSLQIDIGFNDPIPIPPQRHVVQVSGRDHEFACIAPELGFAWKLHGLVEWEGHTWRPKDLADLWLLVDSIELDCDQLKFAITSAMTSRDAPPWRLGRLLRCMMGRSSGSIRRWRKFRADHPECELPESLHQSVATVAKFLASIVDAGTLESPVVIDPPTLHEMQKLQRVLPRIRGYDWDNGGFVFVNERHSGATHDLSRAETKTKFRKWICISEARGITFGADGSLLSRPYAQFQPIDQLTEEQLRTAEVLEKLDGSLVFPTRSVDGYVWRTRRRRSGIADDAAQFANGSNADYEGLISICLSRSETPLFEWCSRKRWIVLDHPVDRLVLTGIRKHACGRLMPFAEMNALAKEHGVECVQRFDTDAPLQSWLETVDGWTDREGCIIRLATGRQFKVKSRWYRLLHQTVEGNNRERARWELILRGAKEDLIQCNLGRGIDLTLEVMEIEDAITRYVTKVITDVAEYGPKSSENRKQLAIVIQGKKIYLSSVSVRGL